MSAERVEPLTTVYTTPGFTDEKIHLFVAYELTAREPKRDPDEFIEVVPKQLSQVLEWIRVGEVRDAKTVAAVLYLAGFVLVL